LQPTRAGRIERPRFAKQHARGRTSLLQLPSYPNWSFIYLARRFAVVSTDLCWRVYCSAKQTAAAAFNAVLRATAVCGAIRTHGFL
jgi:hypothetical protein